MIRSIGDIIKSFIGSLNTYPHNVGKIHTDFILSPRVAS